ncbi:MAG: hypothetical protein Q9163_002051 [Psora crenata]
MSPGFTFDFRNADIEDEVAHVVDDSSVAGSEDENQSGLSQPILHTLDDLTLDGAFFHVPRRELYDIRAQLMAEDTQAGENNTPIPGLSTDDIVPHVYEGGFKTWECAIDLANYLVTQHNGFARDATHDARIVELGAGTALPSSSLLQQWKSGLAATSPPLPNLDLIVADYNQYVLELATLPNIFLSWEFTSTSLNGEYDTTPVAIAEFVQDLKRHNVTISAISGGWGSPLISLMTPFPSTPKPVDTLILASETIYSTTSIHNFVQVLMDLLSNAESTGGAAKALVAAKRVYFGVGGGVDEFCGVLKKMGGAVVVVWETEGVGVGRVILEVVKAR